DRLRALEHVGDPRRRLGPRRPHAARVDDEPLARLGHAPGGEREPAPLDERLAAADPHDLERLRAEPGDELLEGLEVGDRRAVAPRVDRAVRAPDRAAVGDEQQRGPPALVADVLDLAPAEPHAPSVTRSAYAARP